MGTNTAVDGMCRYEDIAEAAFGRRGRDVMMTILYTELLGTCALFLLLQKGVATCNQLACLVQPPS